MMNDLAIGPLPARPKKECDAAGEKIVFRCGVVSCPEVFGAIRSDFMDGKLCIYAGYIQNRDGIFAATRRSAQRIRGEREHHKELRNGLRQKLDQVRVRRALNPDAEEKRKLDHSLKYVAIMETFHPRHQLEGLQVPDLTLFPVVIRCRRCGRLSKIEKCRESA